MVGIRLVSTLAVVALIGSACTAGDAAEPAPTSTFAPLLTQGGAAPQTAAQPTTPSTTEPPPAKETTTSTTLPANECVPEPVAGFDDAGFFTQGCTVLGIDIVASSEVAPEALIAAAERIHGMLVGRLDYAAYVASSGITAAVIGADERITDLPPFQDLYEQYPGTDWRRAGRSFTATDLVPWFAGAEENLSCTTEDRYEGEDMLLRDLARTVRDYPMRALDASTDSAIESVYGRAIAAGLWRDTLAENNSDTYWMEGVQSWFDGNREADPPDTAHNHVDTRRELAEYDPALADLIRVVLGDGGFRAPCG